MRILEIMLIFVADKNKSRKSYKQTILMLSGL